MKIDQIILSLKSIKKENEESISKNKIEIEALEKVLKELEDNILNLDSKENKYKKLKSIKGSMLKIIKIFLITVEVPIIIGLLMLMVYLAESFNLCLVLASVCSLLTFDIMYTYYKEVSPVSDESSGVLKNYLECLNIMLSDMEDFDMKLRKIISEKNNLQHKYDEILNTKALLQLKCSQMSEENDYIEGNEIGINILSDKYQMEEVSDNLEVVEFVNKRLERKV